MSRHSSPGAGNQPPQTGAAPHERREHDSRSDSALELLQDVALKLNETHSVDHALALAVDRICRHTRWPVGHAYLVASTDDGLLTSSGIFHLEDADAFEPFRQATLHRPVEAGNGLAGRVLHSGRSDWITDCGDNPTFPRKDVRDLGLVAGFACPILTGDRVVGVLEFYARTRQEVDHRLLSAASNIGAQIGRVIEREQAAEASRESEERLRALTDSLLEAIITSDDEGTIIDWNPQAERTFGYTVEEAVGRSVELIMPERHVSSHRSGMERYRRTLKPEILGTMLETEGVRKDGSEIPIELSLSTWTAGGERFYTAVIRDVSERRQAEEEIGAGQERLRKRERQLARAQRIAHLGSWEWNVETGELAWSAELHRIYGLDPDVDVTYEMYASLHHPEDRDAAEAAVHRALETHEPFSFRHRIVRADTGEVRVLHGEGEVELDDHGVVVKMFGTALDVTALERVEEDLRESERKFRLLAENMTDLILLQDPVGDLVYVSPSSRRILGYDPAELYGTNFYELLDEEDARRLRNGAHGEMLDGKSYTEELVRARADDGSVVWIELAGKPIVEPDGSIERLLTSARDVTVRIRAESDAERYRTELEKRNRELQDFAYVASHDLQEPLRKIRAFADLVEADYGELLGGEGRLFLARMKDAATRMSTLIRDLLSFSRVTTSGGSFQKTDLNVVLEGVLSDLEIAIRESNATIEADELLVMDADPLQMRQLLQNLISNAIKFRKPDEPPIISVRSRTLQRVARAGAGTEWCCCLEVSDNGMGFDSMYADRIFSPFQRLHNRSAVEGTGMGLAICRRIVERHDGRISVESEPDVGSTFIVEIPIHQTTVDGA